MKRVAIVFVVLGLASVSVVGRQAAAPAPALELLDRYDRGERDVVAALLARLPERAFGPLAKDLEHVAEPWTRAKGQAAAPRRRLVAATLALEVTRAGLTTEWTTLRSLTEFGCGLVRQNPPGDLERHWQLASIALYGGARDEFYMSKHLEHASAEFPHEPRFRLAQAVAKEFPVAYDRWRRGTPWVLDKDLALMVGPFLGRFESDRRNQIRAAARDFGDLLKVPDIQGEASLRIGHLLLLLHDEALAERAILSFKNATTASDDRFTRYLAFFLTGQALEIVHRPHEAQAAYRQALGVIPHVQSGIEALAALLFLDGKPDESCAIVQAGFEAQPRPPDVWRLYGFGDYVRWPELIGRLRVELK